MWQRKSLPRARLQQSSIMPLFQYKALLVDGSIAEGEIEAGGRHEAFRQMESRGLRPISLADRNGVKTAKPPKPAKEAKAEPKKEKEKETNGAATPPAL